MTRKKVKLAFISNDSSRKATFKKRKKGLMKKVNELPTLCGIKACAIIYSPYDTNPEVWPSNSGVERIVSGFRTLPEMDQHKKMVDQETFLRQRIAKATEQLRRKKKESRELEMTEVMFQSLVGNMEMFHLNILDLNDLGYIIEQYLTDINRKIEFFRNSGMEIGESSNAVVPASDGIESIEVVASTTVPAATINEMGSSSSTMDLFNPLQQQHHQEFRHPAAPHVGFYEQHQYLNLNRKQNHNQSQQQWFMKMMNHPEQPSYAAEQMGFPFIDDNHQNNNHHYHHHQPQQQQQIPGDPSTAPSASSSSIIPITSPNPTNNIWFR
ncbi:Agamous-like MADS-box protein AGL80 [Cardamine amara subsp. amara]|uniref:Agamous-like MADS-box protein AGL80 n=1 Tax=Cardamine amara subsp. amara TaxID=228776 RepID=A0ABD1C8V5_CARAN